MFGSSPRRAPTRPPVPRLSSHQFRPRSPRLRGAYPSARLPPLAAFAEPTRVAVNSQPTVEAGPPLLRRRSSSTNEAVGPAPTAPVNSVCPADEFSLTNSSSTSFYDRDVADRTEWTAEGHGMTEASHA